MKHAVTTSLLAVLFLTPTAASADGLIYQLPADGTSLTFDLQGSFERRGETRDMTGHLKISSVGKETVDDQPCRWIEFEMSMKLNGEDRTIYAKVLVPESELAKGKSPIDHVRKAWFKPGDQNPREITDFTSGIAGPLPAFLCGPLEDVEKKDPTTVKSGLGEHECQVSTGSTSFDQGSTTHKYNFTHHEHDAAPFGLVKTEIRIEMERNGEAVGSGTMTMVAKEIGKDAQAVITNGR